MKNRLFYSRFRIIIALIVLTPMISIFCVSLLLGTPGLVFNIADYFLNQKTLFNSSNSSLNILWFLPKNLQIIPLTLPQLNSLPKDCFDILEDIDGV